jgi:DNA-binding FadR family transcriptional regulator
MSEPPSPEERSKRRSPLTPVARGGLSDRVIDQLREHIADGTWPLDHRLPGEAAMASDLGVGRSTIREAVRVLVHAGLLEVRQGDGTYVRSKREIDAALQRRLTEAHLLEAYEVRGALEVAAARLAAQRRTDADVLALRALLKHRDAAYTTSSQAYRKADIALHEQIVDATGNTLLADLYRSFLRQPRAGAASDFDDIALTLDCPDSPEMRDLVRAIEDEDPVAAAATAERRMDNSMRILRFWLQVVVVRR